MQARSASSEAGPSVIVLLMSSSGDTASDDAVHSKVITAVHSLMVTFAKYVYGLKREETYQSRPECLLLPSIGI